MAQSKSKRTARAVSFTGMPRHPALGAPDPLLAYRMGQSLPLRLPDNESAPSAATVLRSEYTVGSNSNGVAVFGEDFSLSQAKIACTVTAGVVDTSVGTSHPQATAFFAEARVARMVAMRIQVLYIGTEQEKAGFLSYSEKTSGLDVLTQTLSSMHSASDIQVPAPDGLVVYVDYTQLPRWEVPSGNSFMQYTFPMAIFAAEGLPPSKTSLFRVRVERFLEYLPVEGALAEGELQHEPANPGALSVHGALSGPHTSIFSPQNASAFYAKVKGVANAAYHMAQPLIPYIVPKARQYLQSAALTTVKLLL